MKKNKKYTKKQISNLILQNKLLASEQRLKEHQEGYIHIPWNWKKVGIFLLFLLSLTITIGYFQIFLSEWNTHNIGSLFDSCNEECLKNTNVGQLVIIPHLVFQYILTSFSILSFFSIFKRKLKELNKCGLVFGLVVGLVFGLVFGLVGGLVGGLVFGPVGGLVGGLVVGLLGGLVFGLVVGLVVGLLGGLSNEFNGDDE